MLFQLAVGLGTLFTALLLLCKKKKKDVSIAGPMMTPSGGLDDDLAKNRASYNPCYDKNAKQDFKPPPEGVKVDKYDPNYGTLADNLTEQLLPDDRDIKITKEMTKADKKDPNYLTLNDINDDSIFGPKETKGKDGKSKEEKKKEKDTKEKVEKGEKSKIEEKGK